MPRDNVIQVRVNAAERRLIEARANGQSVSDYVRSEALRGAGAALDRSQAVYRDPHRTVVTYGPCDCGSKYDRRLFMNGRCLWCALTDGGDVLPQGEGKARKQAQEA